MRRRNNHLLLLLWLPPAVFLAAFYFYPLTSILGESFSRGEGGMVASLVASLQRPSVWQTLWFTIWQAMLSTLLTLGVGLPGAYLLARYTFRGKALFKALSSIPFVMPTLVVAAAFNALLGPQSWLNLALMSWFRLSAPPLHFTNSLTAILVAHVFYNTTIVLRMIGDFWSRLDPRLSQAAQVLGANRWLAMRRVTLPLLWPAIITAALLVFIFDFTSFGVILVLGGPHYATLEVEIYYQTASLFNLPLAATLSILQLACTLGMTVIYTRLAAKISRPLALRPQQYNQKSLGSSRQRILALSYAALLAMLFLLPLIALALRSLTVSSRGGALQLTMAAYQELFVNRRSSIFYVSPATSVGISLSYALATVAFALILGLPAAWALARRNPARRDLIVRLNAFFDPVLMLPLGTSAVTLGLGFILALGKPPLNLRTSPILIPLAHTLVAFPFVVRSLTPALRSIQPRLRQAATILGASPLQVLRSIDIPIAGRAVLVAATFAFMISMGEFGATALIARPEFPTLPIAIYRYLSQPGALNYSQALALSTILMTITAAGMLAIEHFRIAEVGEF